MCGFGAPYVPSIGRPVRLGSVDGSRQACATLCHLQPPGCQGLMLVFSKAARHASPVRKHKTDFMKSYSRFSSMFELWAFQGCFPVLRLSSAFVTLVLATTSSIAFSPKSIIATVVPGFNLSTFTRLDHHLGSIHVQQHRYLRRLERTNYAQRPVLPVRASNTLSETMAFKAL